MADDLRVRAKAAIRKLGEGIEETTPVINVAGNVVGSGAGTVASPITTDDTFLKTLQEKLLGGLDFVSSQDTGLESFIETQKARFETAEEKRTTGIEAGAERLAGEIEVAGARR